MKATEWPILAKRLQNSITLKTAIGTTKYTNDTKVECLKADSPWEEKRPFDPISFPFVYFVLFVV